MVEQLSFDGFEAPPPPRRKLSDAVFFALLPDMPARYQIAGIADNLVEEHHLTGRRVGLDRLHASLWGGHCSRERAGTLLPTAEAVMRHVRCGSFEVRFDRAMSFKSRTANYPLVLTSPTTEILALFRILARAFGKVFGVTQRNTITPHVTMLYDPAMLPAQPIEPVTWMAREVVLIHSLRGLTQHVVLGRWPLEG